MAVQKENKKIRELLDQINSLTVLELKELLDLLVTENGLDLSQIASAPSAQSSSDTETQGAKATSTVNLLLKSVALDDRIKVMNVIKTVCSLDSLIAAKAVIDKLNTEKQSQVLKSNISRTEAEDLAKKFAGLAVEVEIK